MVDEPEPSLALEMLLAGLPVSPAENELPAYRDLAAQRLGSWPLLINLIAGEITFMIDEGTEPERAFATICQGLDEEGLTAFELARPRTRLRYGASVPPG